MRISTEFYRASSSFIFCLQHCILLSSSGGLSLYPPLYVQYVRMYVSVFLAIYRAMRDSSTSEVYGAICRNLIAAVLSDLFSDILSVFSRISIMTNVCSGTKTVIYRTMMTEWRKLSNFWKYVGFGAKYEVVADVQYVHCAVVNP